MRLAINGWNFNKKIVNSFGEEYFTDNRCNLSLNDMEEGKVDVYTLSQKGKTLSTACKYIIHNGVILVDKNVLWEERFNDNDFDFRNYGEYTPSYDRELKCLREIATEGFVDLERDVIFTDREEIFSTYKKEF